MGKLLGVDAFIETATGRGAATGKGNKRKKKNPYSCGCLTNCKDFWCDPAPVFGKRENGSAVLDGVSVNYTDLYESFDDGCSEGTIWWVRGRPRAGGIEYGHRCCGECRRVIVIFHPLRLPLADDGRRCF